MPYPYSNLGADLPISLSESELENVGKKIRHSIGKENFNKISELAQNKKISNKQFDSFLQKVFDDPITLRPNYDVLGLIKNNPEALKTFISEEIKPFEYKNFYVDTPLKKKSVSDPESTMDERIVQESRRSADKLFERYKTDLEANTLKKTLEEILNWAKIAKGIEHNKALTPKIMPAALEAIENIIRDNSITDKYQITELLALTWIAIHDKDALANKDTDSLQAAEKIFAEILYDIQNGAQRSQICPKGTLNKLVEGLRTLQHEVVADFKIEVKNEAEQRTQQQEVALVKNIILKHAESFLKLAKDSKHIEKLIENNYCIDQNLWDQIKNKVHKEAPAILKIFNQSEAEFFENFVAYIALDSEKWLHLDKTSGEIEETQVEKDIHLLTKKLIELEKVQEEKLDLPTKKAMMACQLALETYLYKDNDFEKLSKKLASVSHSLKMSQNRHFLGKSNPIITRLILDVRGISSLKKNTLLSETKKSGLTI